MVEKMSRVMIGLEVHGYLDTREKLFCMCRTDSLENGANFNICPICTGTPGSKPMAVNLEAVRKMVQIAEVFGSRINSEVVWQRKHYDWADNPKGYQTTVSGAHAKVNAVGGKFKGINITEIHLEEDPAQWNPDTGRINYNRSGLPLIEIVTEPEFSDSEQVVEWLKSLLLSLSYIKAVRKNAGIKVDVNVSVGGERVEMKNLNSLEKIRKAINYEIVRQSENNAKGVVQKRDTMAYDESKGITIKMRSKEGASDYRFISDPDLAVMKVSKKMIVEVRAGMPEMPEVKLARLLKVHKVGAGDAKILTRNLELVDFFEELVEMGKGKIGSRMNTDEHGLSKKRVVFMCGKDKDPDSAWYPWFGKEIEKMRLEFVVPRLPKIHDPVLGEWLAELDKISPNENDILIGHSRGGMAIMRWLEKLPKGKKVGKVVLLAANNPDVDEKNKNKDTHGFYEGGSYNFEKIKRHCDDFVVIHSRDDVWVDFKSGEANAEGLGAVFKVYDDKIHFGKNLDEVPELLEEIDKKGEPRTDADGRGHSIDIKKMISWVTVELLRVLNYNKKSLEDEDVEILPAHLAELIGAVEKGEITVLKGKQIMNDFVPKSFSLKEHKGEIGNIDEAAVENLCRQVISENGHVVEEYRGGKAASLNFLIGSVMRLSERRADFKVAGDCLKRLIGGDE